MKKKAKENAKKKSFFFQDYTESEIITTNSNLAKVSLNRTTFLFFVFLSLIVIFCEPPTHSVTSNPVSSRCIPPGKLFSE